MKICEQHQVIMALGLWFVEECTDAEREFLDKAVKFIADNNGNNRQAMTQAWFKLETSDVRYAGCILWTLADVIEKIKDRYVRKEQNVSKPSHRFRRNARKKSSKSKTTR